MWWATTSYAASLFVQMLAVPIRDLFAAVERRQLAGGSDDPLERKWDQIRGRFGPPPSEDTRPRRTEGRRVRCPKCRKPHTARVDLLTGRVVQGLFCSLACYRLWHSGHR